jgi:hypothetical protein
MLGQRSPQGELFRPDHLYREHVGEATFYGWLATQGAAWFRDEDFVGLYREDFGRPSVPPSQLCVALLLQAHDGVSDAEAIARTAYDLRWKVALGLELGAKLCAKSTLQLFRAKLVLHEAYGQVFERSVAACRAAGLLGVRPLEVAIDTTPILGRGAVKDTYNLVSDQIRRVVQAACAHAGWDAAALIAEHGLGRHFGASFKGSVELDWSDEAAQRALLSQLVADAQVALALADRALEAEGGDGDAGLTAARALLAELLVQDIETAPEDGEPRLRQGTASDRIVSTTDPAMRHGRKSAAQRFDGYKATVVTNTEDGVILATDVQAANVADREHAAERVVDAAACAGQPVACVLGDTAYGDTTTRRQLKAHGCEVVAKVPPGTRRGMFSLEDFTVADDGGVVVCPAGQRSVRRDRVVGADPGWRYIFSRRDCGPCGRRAQCTKSVRAARILQITARTEQLQRLRREQRTERFRRRYRLRVVVEHRIARLVQLGVRQARYLGQAKVAFQVALAAAVANLTLAQAASPAICAAAALRAARTAGFCGLAWVIRPFLPVSVDRTSTVHAGLIETGRLPNPMALRKMAPSRPGF